MPAPTPLDTTRYSLQAPCGLPSPLPSLSPSTSSSLPATQPRTPLHSETYREPTLLELGTSPADDNTLMACFAHLSISHPPRGRSGDAFPRPPSPRPSSKIGSREQQRKMYYGPKLSDRATGGPDAGPLIERFSCLFQDQYDSVSNPKGIVSLGVAENFLMQNECMELFTTALRDNMTPMDLSYGDSLWGSRRINKALSGMYNDWFHPAEEVKPEHIITGVGCSAVLDQLFYTLMDEGEAVLIAAPYYAGFDRDLIGRGRIRIIPVHLPPNEVAFSPASLKLFEEKLEQVNKEGITVRAVIVCNPQNPLGKTYSRETLLAYAKFCEERDLHLVSDEIYGLSVYENKFALDALLFTSMMALDVEKELGIPFDKARLHVVYGMSKDFCANGLRVGSLISQNNPLLLRAMANTSMLMKSTIFPADVIWSTLLLDKPRLHSFITTNRGRLAEAQAFTRTWFEARGVEVADSNAGNFIFVNLGRRLGFTDAQTEKKVFQKLLDGGVYTAPGSAYHYDVVGWFRVTFSVPRGNLVVGLERIERLLDLKPTTNDA